MTRIGVISDTHLSMASETFRNHMENLFAGVNMLIHAGDMTALPVFEYLSTWRLHAVLGNMDGYELEALLPRKKTIEIEGKKIGIVHGRGTPQGITEVALSEFQDVDVIVCGHSHQPLVVKKRATWIFNPGAYKPSYAKGGSAGIMEIGEKIMFKHISIPS
jgi:putative phosphoesterase